MARACRTTRRGIVVALSVLKILDELKFKDYARITLMLNTNEETGSRGSRALIEKLAREHDVTLNLEGGRIGDGIMIWRKGSGTINVEVKGRASHAGGCAGSRPQRGDGTGAPDAAARKLANAEKGTTVNFTVIKAGDRKNVIPDYAVADADIRALVSEEFDRVEREMAEVAKNKLIPDTEVTATLTRSFPIMPQNAQTDALAAMAQRVYGEIGRTLTARRQRRRRRFEPVGRRVQADARRPEPRRRQRAHRPGIRRGRQHGAAVLSSDPHGDGTGQRTNDRGVREWQAHRSFRSTAASRRPR